MVIWLFLVFRWSPKCLSRGSIGMFTISTRWKRSTTRFVCWPFIPSSGPQRSSNLVPRCSLAFSITFSGSTSDGVILSIMMSRLIIKFGFGWTMRIVASRFLDCPLLQTWLFLEARNVTELHNDIYDNPNLWTSCRRLDFLSLHTPMLDWSVTLNGRVWWHWSRDSSIELGLA